jgi:hypothetical protein
MIRRLGLMGLLPRPAILLLPLLPPAQGGESPGAGGGWGALPDVSCERLEASDAGVPGDGIGFPGRNRRWTDESPSGFDTRSICGKA